MAKAADRGRSRSFVARVWLIVCPPDRVSHCHVAVLLEVMKRTFGCIDGQMGEIWAAQTLQLGVQVREVPTLEKWIIAEVDTGGHVLGHEGNLLRLGEEIVGHPAQVPNGLLAVPARSPRG